ncbi:MAG: L,D-transpeptidase [Gammaproteobacteria bacterium]
MKFSSPILASLLLCLLPLQGAPAAGKAPPKNTSTPGTAITTAPSRLKPGEYLWVPEVSPRGPVVMVVSLPEQRAYVYRNGVLIGASTVSTGKKGYETPTGVFTILQKHEDHYSNVYDNAPMPFMQRLTWSGVALHAGRLPGYPASHGCVRMPYDFAQKLYGATKTGLTVVVSDAEQFPATVVNPGLVAPVDATGAPVTEPSVVTETFWRPEASPEGPVTILVTNDDRRITVFRSGVEIGRASIRLREPGYKVSLHVLTMLEPSGVGPLDPVTGQPIPRWLMVSGEQEDTVSTSQLLAIFDIPDPFLRQVATVAGPGTTLVVTRLAASGATTTAAGTDFTVVTAEEPASN